MYISRLPLNTARRDAARLLASPYRMHAAVENAFPPGTTRDCDEGRILWRIDPYGQRGGTWLYVVSPEQPDFSHIAEQCGWPPAAPGETKDYSPVLDALVAGQVWRFRLKANPARKVATDKGRRDNPAVVGKIQGHVTVAQQLEWLEARSVGNGFELASEPDGSSSVVVSQRHAEEFRRNGSKVTIDTAMFDGVLVVKDPTLLRHALCHGIGRAKGFGCGLMTIMPVG